MSGTVTAEWEQAASALLAEIDPGALRGAVDRLICAVDEIGGVFADGTCAEVARLVDNHRVSDIDRPDVVAMARELLVQARRLEDLGSESFGRCIAGWERAEAAVDRARSAFEILTGSRELERALAMLEIEQVISVGEGEQ